MFFDPVYLALLIIFMVIGLLVQFRLKSVFGTYSKIPLRSGQSGKEIAEKMLRENGIYDVRVISTQGRLTDHYNPADKTVNLSEDVYEGRSITSAAIAAHECGHAVQHAENYSPLKMRSSLVPMVNFASMAMNFIYIGMFILAFSYQLYNQALLVIIVAQAFITLFALITLPVELDASRRALAWVNASGIAYGEEHEKAQTALRWAAMTYFVAALAAVAQLIFFIMQYAGRRD
ncbi:MAG: zinc metallopeptidase [Bacteroidota bacterium]|nr:zinc metallopeptidase [Bacteroidota bacterium]